MKSVTLKSMFASALFVAGFTLPLSASNASTFNLDVIVNSNADITNTFVYTSGPAFTTSGPRSITGGSTTDIFISFPFPDPSSAYHVMLLGVVASGSHTGGLALFTNTSFTGAGQSFSTVFPGADEAALVSDLMSNHGSSQNLINFVFNSGVILSDGFVPGDLLTITAFSNGEVIGSSTSSAIATPLPGAFPLFATSLGALGLLVWRRKRKAAA